MKFYTYLNTTLQAPDNIDLADFPMLTLADEVGWSWYLSQVKQNMEARIFPEHENDDNMGFIHAKYYPREYQMIDRVGAEPHHRVAPSVYNK
jgi:hypothetical protein